MDNELEYNRWNGIKQAVSEDKSFVNFNEKDIFMTYVGKNIGFEQNGDKDKNFLRPVLVYKKFSNKLFLGIPLTKTKKDNKFYYSFQFKENTISTAILSQVKLTDNQRLKYRMGKIKNDDYKKLAEKFKKLIDVTP